jgi:hypothetical protein
VPLAKTSSFAAVVTFGVIVAVVELTNHEREIEKARREATLKWIVDETDRVSEARSMLQLLGTSEACKRESAATPSAFCNWATPSVAAISAAQRSSSVGNLYARLEQVITCINATICGRATALELVCNDAALLPGSEVRALARTGLCHCIALTIFGVPATNKGQSERAEGSAPMLHSSAATLGSSL